MVILIVLAGGAFAFGLTYNTPQFGLAGWIYLVFTIVVILIVELHKKGKL